MDKVWIVSSGDYYYMSVDGVFRTPEGAENFIKGKVAREEEDREEGDDELSISRTDDCITYKTHYSLYTAKAEPLRD